MGDNDRITDRTDRNRATSFRDNASGPPEKQEAVTDRPNDLAGKVGNTTFADRAKGVSGVTTGGDSRNSSFADRAKQRAPGKKAVKDGDAENKAVAPKATSAKRS